jgi:hypothetical protein
MGQSRTDSFRSDGQRTDCLVVRVNEEQILLVDRVKGRITNSYSSRGRLGTDYFSREERGTDSFT